MTEWRAHQNTLHEWEGINPADWLKPPYFNIDKCDWVSPVRKLIDDGRAEERPARGPVNDEDIEEMKVVLARFIKVHADWNGFLSKADKDVFIDVQRCAQRLGAAIRALERAKGDDGFAIWYLEEMLKDSDPGWSLADAKALVGFIANLPFESPHFRDDPELKKKWGSPTQNLSRAVLQGEIDAWFRKVSKFQISKDPYKGEKYRQFLELTLGLMVPKCPYSETEIAKARRGYKEYKKQLIEREERLRELGRRIGELTK